MPEYPEFPQVEYQQRYARAQAMMAEMDLDGLLVTNELNYIYFTGHRSPQNSVDNIRPYIYVMHKDGSGVLITMPFEVEHVLECTWITDIQTAGLMDRADEVVQALKTKGLERGRIGCELGREQILGLTYNEFVRVMKALPEAEFVDAASIFLRLRVIKSPAELALMRQASEKTVSATEETFEKMRAGMSEIEVMHMYRQALASHGCERISGIEVISGLGSHGGLNCHPTPRRLQVGDSVVLDGCIEIGGYNSDIARTAMVGEPPAEVAEFYTWMMEVRRLATAQLRAGNTPQDVVTAARTKIAERGLQTISSGRIGHGVGLAATEYPSLAMEEQIVFEPGMVFTCNPNFVRSCGFLNSEDQWIITTGDPELLSAPISPPVLPVIRVP